MWPLGTRPWGCGPKGPKSILYKQSFAYQIEGNKKQNTVVQKVCLGGMSGDHLRSKVGFWVLFCDFTWLLLGFFRTLKLSQVIALWMRTREHIWNFDVQGDMRWRWRGDMRWRSCFSLKTGLKGNLYGFDFLTEFRFFHPVNPLGSCQAN